MPRKIPNIRTVSKKGYVVLDFYFEGKRKSKRIGPDLPETWERAKREKIAIEVAIESGEYAIRELERAKQVTVQAMERRETWRQLTFDELSNQYVEDYIDNPESGPRGTGLKDKRIAKLRVRLLGDDFGSWLVTSIVQDDIKARNTRRLQTVSGSTVNRENTIGKHMFNWAVQNKLLPHDCSNPFRGIRRMQEPPPVAQFFQTEEDAAAVLEHCSPLLRQIVIFARNTGMRRGELVSVHWSQVNKRAQVIELRGDQTKNGRPRKVPLNRTALGILGELPRPIKDGPLFVHSDGREVTADWMTKRVTRALKEAGETGVKSLHGLRHDFGSQLVMEGRSLEQAGAALGHLTPSMTKVYAHLSEAHLLDVVRTLDSRPQAMSGDLSGDHVGAAR